MINHRISNIISRIRLATASSKDGFIIKHSDLYKSKELLDILTFLASNGYINYSPVTTSWYLNFAPDSLTPILSNIKGRSTPGKRIYRGYNEIREDEVVRTSKGIKWGNEARNQRKGGELLLKIYKSSSHNR